MFKWKYPLWYTKNILAVDVEIDGKIDRVMNPSQGTIKADYIGELIVKKDRVDPEKTKIGCKNGKLMETQNACA